VASRAAPHVSPPPLAGQPQPVYPKFPDQDPARKLHFIFLVIGWAIRTAWVWYQSLPKRRKKLVIFIVFFLCLVSWCSDRDRPKEASIEQKAKARQVLADLSQKLSGAAQPKAGDEDLSKVGTDLAKVGGEIAAVVGKEIADEPVGSPDLLAVPFDAPETDQASSKFAGEVFSSAFGKLTIAFPKKVALGKVPVPGEPFDPVKLAKDRGAARVLFGAIHEGADGPTLDITLESTADSKILWAQSFQTKDADSSDIADEIRDHVRGS
jgi:TolB-like protein